MNHGRIAKAVFLPCVLGVMFYSGAAAAGLPLWAAWILTWTVCLLPAIPIALIRRKPHVWAAFWALIVLWVIRVATVALSPGNLTRNASEEGLSVFLFAAIIALYWVMLGNLPGKAQKQVEQAIGQVTHVVHHHVLHAPDGQAREVPPSSWTATVTGSVVPPEVTGSAPKAIEGYVVKASAFIGRRGELAARLREMRRHRP